MQVILTKGVPDLGHAGQVVTVKPGYGSNYLIPRGLAVLATKGNQRQVSHERHRIEAAVAREKQRAEQIARKLSGVSVTLTRIVATDEKDKIFGSVSTRDIEEAVSDKGVKIDRKKVMLAEPIRTLGVHTRDVKLARDVVGKLKVWVVAKQG